MEKIREQLDETVKYINKRTGNFVPRFGIILGTGLSNLADQIETHCAIPYADIPNFPVSTVKSHRGQLIFGHLAGKPVVAMAGRFHYYEGYSMKEATFPVRVMKWLGIELLFVSNAAGGLSQHIHTGDIVFIHDHINLMPEHPLRGKNDPELGPRFPDMFHTYDKKLVQRALDIARENNIRAHAGVYVAVQGPNLETPAEYQYFNRIGGDVVGMSTVPEVLVAKHMDLKVFALSVCTDMGYPLEAIQETTEDDVIAVARSAEPNMTLIVSQMIREL